MRGLGDFSQLRAKGTMWHNVCPSLLPKLFSGGGRGLLNSAQKEQGSLPLILSQQVRNSVQEPENTGSLWGQGLTWLPKKCWLVVLEGSLGKHLAMFRASRVVLKGRGIFQGTMWYQGSKGKVKPYTLSNPLLELFCLFWGHIQWCSRLTLGSVLKIYSWMLRNHMGCQD